MQSDKDLLLKKRIWRWHFFAGIMVIPFAIILAVTGSIYLFKPQIESYLEDSINQRSAHYTQQAKNAIPADSLIEELIQPRPNARFSNYTLAKPNDPSVEIQLQENGTSKIYWIDQYDGTILKEQVRGDQFLQIVKHIHSELLSGNNGSYVVELMASWMIVLIITGLYLWWPTGKANDSTLSTVRKFLLPTLSNLSVREKYKRLHGALGLWLGVMVLVLLLTGLPWTQVWGDGFDRFQSAMNWTSSSSAKARALRSQKPVSDGLSLWKKGNTNNQTGVILKSSDVKNAKTISLQSIASNATSLKLEHPIVIQPPRNDYGVWTIRSQPSNPTARVTLHYDKWTGEELMRVSFDDAHLVSQVVSYGIALHEGALFGVLNQMLGLITALGIMTLSVTGFVMWWSRRPKGQLAAPKKPTNHSVPKGVVGITVVLAAFLPMVAISLVAALVLDFLYESPLFQRGS